MTLPYIRIITTLGLTIAMITPSFAAIEIDEGDFGPSYDTMLVDTIAGKPLQLIAAVAGTAAYIVSLPFSMAGDNAAEAQQKLVEQPWQALNRCLGCTVAEDNFYKSRVVNNNQVRIVIDQPSEILINTDENVVVIPR